MFAHISHIHTEPALSLIDQEGSCLENSLHALILVIEIVEGHEIPQQSIKITIYAKELVDHIDIASLLGQRCILSDQFQKG